MAQFHLTLKGFLKWIYPVVAVFSTLSFPRRLVFNLSFVLVIISFLGLAGYWYLLRDLPSPFNLTSQAIPLTTHILDRKGRLLYKIYRNQNRTLIPLSDIPLALRQATVSIEDKSFYYHQGFSPSGIIRAAWRVATGNRLEGGSTITQQLVKTSLLTPERTLRRKLRELILAFAVENFYSKDQILEMYLNRVSFGGAAYGIEEAALMYFGTPAKNLNLAQAALLAGLPASPTTYSPYGIHPEMAKTRQAEVLRRMVADGYITWDQAQAASSQELVFKPPDTSLNAPHFVMYVRELLAQKYGTDVMEQGGLEVWTSLDLDIQQTAQTAVTEEVAKVAFLHITNGAALVTNPRTGEILAMVGSKNYFDIAADGNVNVALSLRQPGSSIKPLNYALAFSRGFTPASIIEDAPITYRSPGQEPYSPVNYDGRFHGRITLRTALGSSYNVPAVKLLAANGVDNFINFSQSMGITTWTDTNRFGLSLTLGGGEVTMLDLATAYGVFANNGQKVTLNPILAVKDHSGHLLEEFRCPRTVSPLSWWIPSARATESVGAATEITTCPANPVLSPQISFLISDILSDNSARAPAFGFNSDLVIPGYQVAVKTGTTNSLRDNWTIGFTPNLLTAVWVGNNDNTPMSYVASGVTGASPIWHRIMVKLLPLYPRLTFTAPENLKKVAICTLTGQLACTGCPTRYEYFLPGTEPATACQPEQFSPALPPGYAQTQPTSAPPRNWRFLSRDDKLPPGLHLGF